jgi:hypothetical protein
MRMNVLVRGILKDFADRNEFDGLPEHQQFERLAVHSLIGAEMPDASSLEDTLAGDETVGYDCLAIFVNDDLIVDLDEVEEVIREKKPLDVTIYFIQAKTSERISREEILGFGQAVQQFFSPDPQVVESDFAKERRRIKDALYGSGFLFRNRLPILRLFHVTTGQSPAHDLNIVGAAQTCQRTLFDTGLFNGVDFEIVSGTDLHTAYVRSRNRVETTINFQRKVPLPRIPGVNQAFLGVLPATEFLKMIMDDDDNIRKFVFYDNVRDFQHMNPVNAAMQETLQSGDAQLFPVLNNGVTVVAQRVQPVGDDVTVEDYQIVNGCQTSHVLYQARNDLSGDMLIPLRLIVTEDDLVASKITRATNSQTPVPEEDLQALTGFQKELEAHYKGYSDKLRLYYERRSKQYAGENVEQTRVITPLAQIRAFAAMFLNEPRLASGYYRQLYSRVPSAIFRRDHLYEPYFTSAFASYRLDVAFRRKLLEPELRPARYLILCLFKYLAAPYEHVPSPDSKAMVKYCNLLNAILTREGQDGGALSHFKRAGELVVTASDGFVTRDKAKREKLTNDALRLIGRSRSGSMTGPYNDPVELKRRDFEPWRK